jgi:hypothetical protein
MTPRYEIFENAEGTVIKMNGNPIQFSMVLSDAQIAKYLTSRAEQQASCERTTEQMWLAND